MKKSSVLIVDDDSTNLTLLEKHLGSAGFHPVTAATGEDAWEKLKADPEKYDAALLDRMMPGMDGLETLKLIKKEEGLAHLPVIMQTAMAARHEILEGLQAGAYYYVTKPFDKAALTAIVKTAVTDHQRYRRIRQAARRAEESFSLMICGEYSFASVEQGDALASLLAQAAPRPDKVANGLSELLQNAVEHGNLGITYAEKGELVEKEILDSEITRRLLLPENASKRVSVRMDRKDGMIVYHIKDAGQGFDWEKYLQIDPERVFDNHGRGIAMSKALSFDSLEYIGRGNEVKAAVNIQPD